MLDCRDSKKIKQIFTNEFNAKVDKMVDRSRELTTTFTKNAPSMYLGEATECFIYGFFNAAIALVRATLEQILRDKLGIKPDEDRKLSDLIDMTYDKKIIDTNLRSKAIKIRKWGNRYLHPSSKRDLSHSKQKRRAKEVLVALKEIIENLYPPKKQTNDTFV